MKLNLKRGMQADLPPAPPGSWSAAEFDNLMLAITTKLGLTVKPTAKMVTPWRWTAGIDPFDGASKSVRDNLEASVKFLNALKRDVDALAQSVIELRADVQELKEAPAPRPFP